MAVVVLKDDVTTVVGMVIQSLNASVVITVMKSMPRMEHTLVPVAAAVLGSDRTVTLVQMVV